MSDNRRSLPEIPLTTMTTSSQPTTFQTCSSTLFDDIGHYSDIRNVVSGSGTSRIPSWRQSVFDDPGHYNDLEFNLHTETDNNNMGEQRPRSNGGCDEKYPSQKVCAPVQVEEASDLENQPHDRSGVMESNDGKRQDEDVENEDNEGLVPVEVEKARQQERQPCENIGLSDNIADLYSRPMKKR